MNEEQLIKGCIASDERCFKILYESYYGKMLNVCLRFASNREEAKDMLQEGFVRAFKNIHQFNFNGSFEGWLRQAVRNTAINFLKKYRLRNISDSIDRNNETMRLLENKLGSENILSEIAVNEMLELVHHLPPMYRSVFSLYVFEQLQHKEIAEMLDITESTSRSNLTKARIKLQQQINKLNETKQISYVAERI